MKKFFLSTCLLTTTLFFTAHANAPSCECSTGSGTQQCNGICVKSIDANGNCYKAECKTPEGAGDKDCVKPTIGE